jgi:hypothetical protein
MSRHSARGRDLRLAARRDIERILHEAEAFAWQARRDTERILLEDATFVSQPERDTERFLHEAEVFTWQPDVTPNAFCGRSEHHNTASYHGGNCSMAASQRTPSIAW